MEAILNSTNMYHALGLICTQGPLMEDKQITQDRINGYH
jgi:hypothetical protein